MLFFSAFIEVCEPFVYVLKSVSYQETDFFYLKGRHTFLQKRG